MFQIRTENCGKTAWLEVFFPRLELATEKWLKTWLKSLQSDVSNHSRGLMEFGKSLVALGYMTISMVWAHVNKEADGASKLWTKSTLMKVLYHGVSGDGKWALRLLKGRRAIFPLGKNLRQKGGLVGSEFASELSKTSEERGGVLPHFLEFCLIQKSCLNPAACQFPQGEVGRTGIYCFIQPVISGFAFGCVSSQGGAAVSSETKLLPQLKCFPAVLEAWAALPWPWARFVCALPLGQIPLVGSFCLCNL